VRRPSRLLLLSVPAAALAAAVQAAASPLQAVEPFVAVTPTGAQARVEAATAATPGPTAIPTLASTPAPAQRAATPEPSAPPRTPAPVVLRNHLHSADGRLDTAVGVYSDCSGGTALTHAAAAVDTCVTQDTYFVGHNPGVFTPLLSESVGSLITWWDGSGQAHVLRIVAVRSWLRADGVAPQVSAAVVAQFQTCEVSDGSKDWIYDAVAA
jgi:hypothetical protein